MWRTAHQKGPRLSSKGAGGAIAEFVKKRRVAMGITQRRLAELTGLSLAFIQDVERGSTHLRFSKVLELLSAVDGVIIVQERFVDQSLPFEED